MFSPFKKQMESELSSHIRQISCDALMDSRSVKNPKCFEWKKSGQVPQITWDHDEWLIAQTLISQIVNFKGFIDTMKSIWKRHRSQEATWDPCLDSAINVKILPFF